MPKGKPWTKEQEKQLGELATEGKSATKIAGLMEKSYASVASKMSRLNLKVDDNSDSANNLLLSSPLKLPDQIPSVETVLKMAVAALMELDTPGLAKDEVYRLRSIVHSAGVVQVRIANFVNYRQIEEKLIELDEKYEKLAQEGRPDSKI